MKESYRINHLDIIDRRSFIKSCGAALSCLFVRCGRCMEDSADAGGFTIMSYNIRHGAGIDGKLDLARIGCIISAASPRFVGIQEVDMLTKRVHGLDTCDVLAKATGLHATFAKAIFYSGGEYGVALLSREKPLNVRRIPLPGAEPRVLLLCEFNDCWIGNTHLDVSMKGSLRLDSVKIIEREVRKCAGKPVFLMGDWNAKPSSDVLSAIRGYMRIISCENVATFHGKGLRHPKERENSNHCIDYIAVNAPFADSLEIKDTHVVEERVASDHAPIVVTVRRRGGARK